MESRINSDIVSDISAISDQFRAICKAVPAIPMEKNK